MFIIEILALCGVVQIITSSHLFAPARDKMPTASLKYMVTCSQCIGFWVGFCAYSIVVLCSAFGLMTDFVFPIATGLASVSNLFVQLLFLILLGGLTSVSAILTNHTIEWLHFAKLWYVVEVERQSIENQAVMIDQQVSMNQQDNS